MPSLLASLGPAKQLLEFANFYKILESEYEIRQKLSTTKALESYKKTLTETFESVYSTRDNLTATQSSMDTLQNLIQTRHPSFRQEFQLSAGLPRGFSDLNELIKDCQQPWIVSNTLNSSIVLEKLTKAFSSFKDFADGLETIETNSWSNLRDVSLMEVMVAHKTVSQLAGDSQSVSTAIDVVNTCEEIRIVIGTDIADQSARLQNIRNLNMKVKNISSFEYAESLKNLTAVKDLLPPSNADPGDKIKAAQEFLAVFKSSEAVNSLSETLRELEGDLNDLLTATTEIPELARKVVTELPYLATYHKMVAHKSYIAYFKCLHEEVAGNTTVIRNTIQTIQSSRLDPKKVETAKGIISGIVASKGDLTTAQTAVEKFKNIENPAATSLKPSIPNGYQEAAQKLGMGAQGLAAISRIHKEKDNLDSLLTKINEILEDAKKLSKEYQDSLKSLNQLSGIFKEIEDYLTTRNNRKKRESGFQSAQKVFEEAGDLKGAKIDVNSIRKAMKSLRRAAPKKYDNIYKTMDILETLDFDLSRFNIKDAMNSLGMIDSFATSYASLMATPLSTAPPPTPLPPTSPPLTLPPAGSSPAPPVISNPATTPQPSGDPPTPAPILGGPSLSSTTPESSRTGLYIFLSLVSIAVVVGFLIFLCFYCRKKKPTPTPTPKPDPNPPPPVPPAPPAPPGPPVPPGPDPRPPGPDPNDQPLPDPNNQPLPDPNAQHRQDPPVPPRDSDSQEGELHEEPTQSDHEEPPVVVLQQAAPKVETPAAQEIPLEDQLAWVKGFLYNINVTGRAKYLSVVAIIRQAIAMLATAEDNATTAEDAFADDDEVVKEIRYGVASKSSGGGYFCYKKNRSRIAGFINSNYLKFGDYYWHMSQAAQNTNENGTKVDTTVNTWALIGENDVGVVAQVAPLEEMHYYLANVDGNGKMERRGVMVTQGAKWYSTEEGGEMTFGKYQTKTTGVKRKLAQFTRKDEFILYTVEYTNTETNETKTVDILVFTGWNKFKAPKDPESALEIIRFLDSYKRHVVVQSSTGAGRAGTLVAIKNGMELCKRQKINSLTDIILPVRLARIGAVSNVSEVSYVALCFCRNLMDVHHVGYLKHYSNLEFYHWKICDGGYECLEPKFTEKNRTKGVPVKQGVIKVVLDEDLAACQAHIQAKKEEYEAKKQLKAETSRKSEVAKNEKRNSKKSRKEKSKKSGKTVSKKDKKKK
uniref:Tyrosine-protein phosphatase domain-containing protein n=1 Tax=Caenorhabditis tropicalis TaxID=1561998 RepID=A0A1I7UP58_9PELO